MSWKKFVTEVSGGAQGTEIASKTGLNQSTVSRWLSTGQPGQAVNVVKFARVYGRSPLSAFIAAGWITAAEARARPATEPDFSQLSNDDLLELVRSRMTEEVTGNAEHPAANKAGDEAPVINLDEKRGESDLSSLVDPYGTTEVAADRSDADKSKPTNESDS